MNNTGVIDLVPVAMREQWASEGYYPDRTVYELFCDKARENPEKPAVLEMNGTTTYGQLAEAAARFANSLLQQGITNGDVVVYQLTNSWRSCAIDLACAAIGAVVCPIPLGRGRLDIESVLKRSNARAVITERAYGDIDYCDVIESIRPVALSLRVLIVNGAKPDSSHAAWNTLNELFENDPLTTKIKVNPNSPVRFLISSGTESEPKLVAYSHNAMLGGRGRFLERITRPNREFRALYLMPLGTAFGSSATFGVLSWMGGSIVLLPKFDVATAIEAIDQHRPSHILGVPTMFQRMAVAPELHQIDLSCLTAIVSGGAIIDKATIYRCVNAFDCRLISLYGSADGINCHNTLDDSLEDICRSVGRPNPDVCEIRIVDDQKQPLPQGETGEIAGRGPMSPMQYVNAPDLDQRYRDDEGWVYTGDLGCIDADGYLVLLGRKKDVIIRGGMNISPVQIEKLATSHPDVVSAACVPVPDADLGQRVCICLTMREGAGLISLSELTDHLRSKGLEISKLPEYLQFYRQLPMTPAGKVNKKLLTQNVAGLGKVAGLPNGEEYRTAS
ncbi:class I adenylate-forming enzyme family protein [Hahella ganghwensis]|uniref:class I adenylate-forming enzyme family protein n=1 Tax=Hahella ganghwensis TaxID=286420 RepID=UPI000364F021|nr:class I adenylate-forming enzyme family protein [Hahella ganghwensis]